MIQNLRKSLLFEGISECFLLRNILWGSCPSPSSFQLSNPRMMETFSRAFSCHKRTKTAHPAGSDILSRLPPGSAATHRYDVCFLNASPRSFSSRLSCSMSGRLLNVSLQQPTAASSEPALDSESPPSAPREAKRPFKPPAAGLVAAWGSILVAASLNAPHRTPRYPCGSWRDAAGG